MWRQLEDFFLEWCGFALFGYVDVLAHFYFPFGFCQATFLFRLYFCFWLQECAKWDDLVDYCLESNFPHRGMDGT